MVSPLMEWVSVSPSVGQLLNSSGKQYLQAGHSFIWWLGPIEVWQFSAQMARRPTAPALNLPREESRPKSADNAYYEFERRPSNPFSSKLIQSRKNYNGYGAFRQRLTLCACRNSVDNY